MRSSSVAFAFLLIAVIAVARVAASKTHLNVPNSRSAPVTVRAGVKKVSTDVPLGVPLAGLNHGQRRAPHYPLPSFGNYTTWMSGNVGTRDTNWAKALVIETAATSGSGATRIAFVTFDAIGADGTLADRCWNMAAAAGFTVPRENVIFSASHSHSGPGALSPMFLWAIAPATDLLVPSWADQYCSRVTAAMIGAEQALQPAKIDAGTGFLTGVTRNRRAPNPWVNADTIDANLGVLRVDTSDGTPMATLWNYAVHGTCYGDENMQISSDISGAACDAIESAVGGVALFANADAGDIDPTGPTCGCQKDQCAFTGAAKFAAAVKQTRAALSPSDSATFEITSEIVPFGRTQLNITLQRWDNCTHGGELDLCTICRVLDCDANPALPESWVEENPRFTGLRLNSNGKKIAMVTIPGEALIELGWIIRNDTLALGFDSTFLLGYSNNHMGYFATPNEYDWGGYESQMTLFGIGSAQKVADSCKAQASKLVGQKATPSVHDLLKSPFRTH